MKNQEDYKTQNIELRITFYYKRGFRKKVYDEDGKEIIIHREESVLSLLTGDYRGMTTISVTPDMFLSLVHVAKQKDDSQTDFDYLKKADKGLYEVIVRLVLLENPDFKKVILKEFPQQVLEKAKILE